MKRRIIVNLIHFSLIFISLFFPIHWIFKLLLIAFMIVFKHITNVESMFKKKNNTTSLFFGQPGAGKTTFAAFLSQLRHKQGHTVLSNVDIANTYVLDPKADLGTYSTYFDGSGCSVIIDEATLDFDGRGFKSFSASNRNYFSLFRHDCNEVFIFSQAVDFDKRIRDRAATCYYLQRSVIPGFIAIRRIKKILIIEEQSRQMIDGFEFAKFSLRLLWKRPYYKYFDTLDRTFCCKKERVWKSWRGDNPDIIPLTSASSDEEEKTVDENVNSVNELKKKRLGNSECHS